MRAPRAVRALCALLLALGSAPALGCRSEESRVAAHLERAQRYVAESRPREAVLELRSALEIQPQNPEINARLAQVFYRTSDFEQALFYFKETYRLDPNRVGAALEAANVLRWSDPAGADELVDEVLAKNPKLPLAHMRRAEIALNRKDLDAALRSASEAVALAPDDPAPLITLGMAREARLIAAKEKGEVPADALFQEALDTFDKAVALSEDGKGLPLSERARILAVWPGHHDEAARAYRELVEYVFSSGKPGARVPAARAAADFARRSHDAELLQWALSKTVEADASQIWAWNGLARAEENAGRSSDPVYRRMLDARPADPKAHAAYALHLSGLGRVDEAAKDLEDAIAAGVDPAQLLDVLARVYFESRRDEDGRRVVERLQRDYPDAPETKQQVAAAAIRDGHPKQAVAILTQLADTDDQIEVQRLLALAYLSLGQVGKATDAIERCSELGGDTPLIQHLHVHIDHAARRWADVVKRLRRLQVTTHSVTPLEFVMAAESFYELGNEQKGRKILEDVLSKPDPPPAAAAEFARRESGRDLARSYAYLEQALARAPNDPVLLHALTGLDVEKKDVQKAIDRLERVMAETEGKVAPVVVLDRANLYALAKQYDAAERDLLGLLQQLPGYRAAADLLVSVYRQQGKTDAAIASFEEADRSSPLPAASRVVLAQLYAAAGKRDLARAQLEKALAERDDLPAAKNDLAFLLAEQGEDLDRALRLAQEARSALGQDPEVADTLGSVYLKKGLPGSALDQFGAALELSSAAGTPNAVLHYHRGLALQALGRMDEAKEAFEAALLLRKEFPEVREALSKLPGGSSSPPGPS